MSNKVYVVRCPDYESAEEKLRELFEMMGGINRFAAPGENIILKVNLLRAAKPEEAVSTHPAVAGGVARIAKEAGSVPVIADSPGAGSKYDQKTLKKVYAICGMDKAAEGAGVEVNLDTSYQAVSYPEGSLIKHFEIIDPIIKADGVFNLCKLKTHLFTRITGAVKNSFGVIPGLTKPGYHAKLHDTGRFANMLLDLDRYVSPRISIMDAVVAMEGEGPGAGDPRRIGLLLASESALALDVVASEIIGLPREKNPILLEAEKKDYYPNHISEVEVLGAELLEIKVSDFKFPATMLEGDGLGPMAWWERAFKPIIKPGMSVKPRVIKDQCVACGACHEACPMNAITIVDEEYAKIDDKECIRCYCCHEMCPNDAVELRRGLLYRMMHG